MRMRRQVANTGTTLQFYSLACRLLVDNLPRSDPMDSNLGDFLKLTACLKMSPIPSFSSTVVVLNSMTSFITRIHNCHWAAHGTSPRWLIQINGMRPTCHRPSVIVYLWSTNSLLRTGQSLSLTFNASTIKVLCTRLAPLEPLRILMSN